MKTPSSPAGTQPTAEAPPSVQEFIKSLRERGLRRRRGYILDSLRTEVDAILTAGAGPLDVHDFATLHGIKLSTSTAYKYSARRRKRIADAADKRGAKK